MTESTPFDEHLSFTTPELHAYAELNLKVVGMTEADCVDAVVYVLGEADALHFHACFDWSHTCGALSSIALVARDVFYCNVFAQSMALLTAIDAEALVVLPMLRAGQYRRAMVRIHDDRGGDSEKRWLAAVTVEDGQFVLEQPGALPISAAMPAAGNGADAGLALQMAVAVALSRGYVQGSAA